MTTRRLPTTPLPSGYEPTVLWIILPAGGSTRRRATTTKRLPTSPRPAGSTRNAADALLRRGMPTGEKGKYDTAIADFTTAIRSRPVRTLTCTTCARRLWGERANYDKAIADFTEAIRLNPKNAEAYYGRGLVNEIKSDSSKAEADFAEAKKLRLSLRTKAEVTVGAWMCGNAASITGCWLQLPIRRFAHISGIIPASGVK